MMAEPLPAASPGPDLCLLIISSMLSEFEYHPSLQQSPCPCPFMSHIARGSLVAPHPGTCIWVGRPASGCFPVFSLVCFLWSSLKLRQRVADCFLFPLLINFNELGMFGGRFLLISLLKWGGTTKTPSASLPVVGSFLTPA